MFVLPRAPIVRPSTTVHGADPPGPQPIRSCPRSPNKQQDHSHHPATEWCTSNHSQYVFCMSRRDGYVGASCYDAHYIDRVRTMCTHGQVSIHPYLCTVHDSITWHRPRDRAMHALTTHTGTSSGPASRWSTLSQAPCTVSNLCGTCPRFNIPSVHAIALHSGSRYEHRHPTHCILALRCMVHGMYRRTQPRCWVPAVVSLRNMRRLASPRSFLYSTPLPVASARDLLIACGFKCLFHSCFPFA
jgi:hypothetical protein